MKQVESMSIGHYNITGEHETEAAIEFENAYNLLLHSHDIDFDYAVNDAIDSISQKYGVEIKLSIF